ncbi:hypothetical protein [Bradyrhizobium yuanmingense]|uniref:hypothetical protein n=1 Tax=Bradyrhizobium yuanmingense TaxID=108015 RepID=UPI0012E3A337|nr:hypothetical protein [Bradyrhizobium yuanmingense]
MTYRIRIRHLERQIAEAYSDSVVGELLDEATSPTAPGSAAGNCLVRLEPLEHAGVAALRCAAEVDQIGGASGNTDAPAAVRPGGLDQRFAGIQAGTPGRRLQTISRGERGFNFRNSDWDERPNLFGRRVSRQKMRNFRDPHFLQPKLNLASPP